MSPPSIKDRPRPNRLIQPLKPILRARIFKDRQRRIAAFAKATRAAIIIPALFGFLHFFGQGRAGGRVCGIRNICSPGHEELQPTTEKTRSAACHAYHLRRLHGFVGNGGIDVALVGGALVVYRWVRYGNRKLLRRVD
jgi:hypothetical protein